MSFVRIDNLSFAYPGQAPLFTDLSFTIEKEKCLGIRGPSGGGKSTLAQIVAGHLKPTTGRIFIGGTEILVPNRNVFLVHQDADLFPWLTVEKQIALAMGSADHAAMTALVVLTKLSGFENYYPHQLSGGMKKRLSIARALAVRPQLIIFDESFVSLDFDLRREVFADLKLIQVKAGMTMVLISHDPRDLELMCDSEIHLERRR